MTAGTSLGISSTTMQWEAVGAWQGGTVVDVALVGVASDSGASDSGARGNGASGVLGLLASSAGVYGVTSPEVTVVPMPLGITDPDVIAVAWAGSNTLFAATSTGRLFRSQPHSDVLHATQWQEVTAWAGLGRAVVLAASPNFDEDQTLFVGASEGMFRTLDGGANWESANFGLLDEDILCIKCAPTFGNTLGDSEVLWAGTGGGGLYRSRNSARAWRESGFGLPDAAVQSLVFSPNFAEDRTLFVGLEEHGIYVSRDGGEQWAYLALDELSINALACAQPEWLWAGTGEGLWRVNTQSGEETQLLEDEVVLAMAAHVDGQVVAGLFGRGVAYTLDGLSETVSVQILDAALHAPPVVTKIGDELFVLDADGFIAYSDNDGAQWDELEQASAGMTFGVTGARVDAGDGMRDLVLIATTEGGLARWNGDEGTWQLIVESDAADVPSQLMLSPLYQQDQTLLAATQDELRLSQDAGVSWRGITGPWQGQVLLRAQFAATNAQNLLALTVQPVESGHFKVTAWESRDQGQAWDVLAGLTTGVPAVLLAWPQDAHEGAIFLATQHRVIKLYAQGDPSTLQLHQHFFNEDVRVTALVTAPDYPYSNIVWAATSAGLYRSVDRGVSWVLMLDLPYDLPVVWLDVTAESVTIITLGGRVWRAAL